MSELFDDEDKALIAEDELDEVEEIIVESRSRPMSDARRRLENLMDEKRLRNDLEDFIDL